MCCHWKNFGRFAVLAALCGLMSSVSARAQEESSVLVKKQPKPAADAPDLSPPANQPALPPPQNPTAAPTAKPSTPTAEKRPFMRPAEPKAHQAARAELTGDAEPIPPPEGATAAPTMEIRPTPPIKYDTDRDARRMYRHSGEVRLVMVTQDPADGCWYEIPLCIPACCTGEPTMSCRPGIFGRGVVEYCWPSCGFRAIVKFRHIRGDVRVDYEGD